MIFDWLAERRRKQLLESPFPDPWRGILEANVRSFRQLEATEQRRLCDLVQIFVAEKHWEGCGGLVLDDEMRVTIAGHACLLVLNLEHDLYRNVQTILVYPSTVIPKRVDEPMFAAPSVVRSAMPLLGEAHQRGPIILTWDAVLRASKHPERAHNVVYHEFAHKLDMLDGAVDGVPPLASREEYQDWTDVCTRAYEALRERVSRGAPGFLDPYGAVDVGEFFAVVTEVFFDEPLRLEAEHQDLYDVLALFYRQDPAERVRHSKDAKKRGR